MALALGWESSAPIAAPSTSRADELSASVGAPTAAAHIGWEIFGSASAMAADGLKIIVTGNGTFVAPAGGGGTSSAATGGGNWETRNASDADRKSTRLNSSHLVISYAVFCLKKKTNWEFKLSLDPLYTT